MAGEFPSLGHHAPLKRLAHVVMIQKCAKVDQLVLGNVIECMGMMTEALGIIVLSIESVRN